MVKLYHAHTRDFWNFFPDTEEILDVTAIGDDMMITCRSGAEYIVPPIERGKPRQVFFMHPEEDRQCQ